jgi:hypothetical protein
MTVGVGPSSAMGLLLRGLLALWLAICPVFWASATSPAAVPISAPVPVAPAEENEKEEQQSSEVRTAVEWVAPARGDRRLTEPAASHLGLVPAPTRPLVSSRLLARAAPADPFHNGLGSPYLC